MQIYVEQELFCGVSSLIDLPFGKTWNDVDSWYIKWDWLFIKFKDEEEYKEIPLESDAMDAIDWKRPSAAKVYGTDKNDDIDYETILDER